MRISDWSSDVCSSDLPPGVDWSSVLAQRESHIDWLGGQIEAARERLAQAHKALQAAEHELAEAREAFFRAKARQEALEKRRDSWRGEQRALEARQEEDITADLLLAPSPGARTPPCGGAPSAPNPPNPPPTPPPPDTA